MDDWSNWGVENPQGGAQPGQPAPSQPPDQVFGTASATPATEGTIIESTEMVPGTGATVMAGGPRRGRWIAAIGIIACLVLVTSVAAFVAISRSGASSQTLAYAPKSSEAFATVRLDLPGAQHDKVAAFLSHFPGGRDTASFDQKYDQILDKIVGGSSTNKVSWTNDLKPWVQGEISFAATSLVTNYGPGGFTMPTMAPDGSYPTPVFDMDPPQVVLIAMVKDQAKAQAWVTKQETSLGGKFADQTYDGVTMRVGGDTSKATRTSAYAFVDNALLIGSLNAVKDAIDAKTKNSSLAQNSVYQTASSHLNGDNLGWYWMDLGAYLKETLSAAGSGMNVTSQCGNVSAEIPSSWLIGSFVADDTSLTIQMTAGPASSSSSFDWSKATTQSQLVQHMPKNTMTAMEIHSLGKAIDAMVALYDDPKQPAECRQQAASIKAALDLIGGTSWIGDAAALMLTPTSLAGSSTPDAGLLITATSEAAAEKAMLAWPNSLSMSGVPATTQTVDYKGTKITQVVPQDPMQFGSLSPAWARSGTLVVVGTSVGFVKAVVDASPSNSLASADTYKNVMAIAGSQGFMFEYFDMQAYAGLIAHSYQASRTAGDTSYICDTKPYLDPLQAAGLTAAVSGDAENVKVVITVAGKPAPLPSSCTK